MLKQYDPVWFVNSFTSDWNRGNPAAVVLLEEYPPDSSLLALASEFGFSETAFLRKLAPGRYHIRWFTPEVEVPLCGHATLASARALFSTSEKDAGRIAFSSLSGELSAVRKDDLIELDFPGEIPEPCEISAEVAAALGGAVPLEAMSARASRNLILVYADYSDIIRLQPDFPRLAGITDQPWLGIAVTAPCPRGYVCRYFAPREGIDEDPVTGSAQTYLAPYWSAKLDLKVMLVLQASERTGTCEVELSDHRVLIRGQALLYLRGELDPGWRLPGSGIVTDR